MWFNEFFFKILFVKIAPPWSHCPPSRMHSHWGIQKYERTAAGTTRSTCWARSSDTPSTVRRAAVVRAVYGRLVGEAAVLAGVLFHKKQCNSWKKRTRYSISSIQGVAKWFFLFDVTSYIGIFVCIDINFKLLSGKNTQKVKLGVGWA